MRLKPLAANLHTPFTPLSCKNHEKKRHIKSHRKFAYTLLLRLQRQGTGHKLTLMKPTILPTANLQIGHLNLL